MGLQNSVISPFGGWGWIFTNTGSSFWNPYRNAPNWLFVAKKIYEEAVGQAGRIGRQNPGECVPTAMEIYLASKGITTDLKGNGVNITMLKQFLEKANGEPIDWAKGANFKLMMRVFKDNFGINSYIVPFDVAGSTTSNKIKHSLNQLRKLTVNGSIFITFGRIDSRHAVILRDVHGQGVNTKYYVDDPAKMGPEWLIQKEFTRRDPGHWNFLPQGEIVGFKR
jgi:hypothetical protein